MTTQLIIQQDDALDHVTNGDQLRAVLGRKLAGQVPGNVQLGENATRGMAKQFPALAMTAWFLLGKWNAGLLSIPAPVSN